MHSPIGGGGGGDGELHNEGGTTIMDAAINHDVNLDNDDDDNDIETLSNRNNLSGSYSNLFHEKLDDDYDDSSAVLTKRKDMLMMTADHHDDEIRSANEITAGVHRENVYSNIPHQQQHSGGVQQQQRLQSAMMDSGIGIHSDPSLHVYSNIETLPPPLLGPPPPLPPPSSSSSPPQKLHDLSFGGVSNISLPDDIKDAPLVVDALDLDDPVSVAGTFGHTPKKNRNTAMKQQHDIGSAKPVSMEMKNVIPHVVMMTGAGGGGTDEVAPANNSAFCSPSRMRLLHDTTMIDTALDLDSLDGSSLGNNSQACLVKTAIV